MWRPENVPQDIHIGDLIVRWLAYFCVACICSEALGSAAIVYLDLGISCRAPSARRAFLGETLRTINIRDQNEFHFAI